MVVAVFVTVLSLTHGVQALLSRGDPPLLVVEHVVVFVTGVLAGWSIWTGKRWAPWALAAAGVTAAGLVASLGPLLAMDATARNGLWTGAATILVGSALGVWYVRRQVTRDA
jgi:hypothetical protein